MQRYPHEILIQKVVQEQTEQFSPWEENVKYENVYKGECICYLNSQSRYRSQKVMDSVFCVVIPDPTMVDIGENFRACVHYPQSPSKNKYNIIGYVKDFARYSRNCMLFIQVIKENMIAEDMPK